TSASCASCHVSMWISVHESLSVGNREARVVSVAPARRLHAVAATPLVNGRDHAGGTATVLLGGSSTIWPHEAAHERTRHLHPAAPPRPIPVPRRVPLPRQARRVRDPLAHRCRHSPLLPGPRRARFHRQLRDRRLPPLPPRASGSAPPGHHLSRHAV